MKFVNPRNSVAFRKIFGDENKKELLISFLNNLLEFTGANKEIIDITIQPPFQVPKLDGLKETLLALKALDKRDIRYIIDIQMLHTFGFKKQVMDYVNKAHPQQPDERENYPKLNQVIFLGFLDFVLFKDIDAYATRHLMLEEKTNGHYFKDFELNFVELPKFTKQLEQLKDIKEKWIYFVKNAGNMTMIPKELNEPSELKEAFEAANQMSWSKEELEAYDNRGILIQDERGRIELAYKTGLEQGRIERRLEIPRAMLKEGMTPETISRLTGLSIEDIGLA